MLRIGVYLLISLASASAGDRIVAGAGHVPPLHIWEGSQPRGFVVDVLEEAARREGLEIVWRRVGSSHEMDRDLSNGFIDLLPAAMDTPQRKSAYFVSTPWWFRELVLVAKARNGIRSVADLPGKRVALPTAAYEYLVHEQFQDVQLSVPSLPRVGVPAAASALCLGQADAALMAHADAHEVLSLRPPGCEQVPISIVDTPAYINSAIVTRKEMAPLGRRLRNRIDEMTADGTLVRLAGNLADTHPLALRNALALQHEANERYRSRMMSLAFGLGFLLLAGAAFAAWRFAADRRLLAKERDRLARALEERERLEREVTTLSGMLPICSGCKKIRDETGEWQQLEQYITAHSEAQFSHGLCPHCAVEYFPEVRAKTKT